MTTPLSGKTGKDYKIGVVLFHSNIDRIYKKEWIDKCISSILNQTVKDFNFYEIDYNGDNKSVLTCDKKYWSIKLKNYATAMNFIITEAFNDGCDYIFNVNLDDFYSDDRFEKQLNVIKNGYDIVSSDFCYVDNNDNIINPHIIDSHCNIEYELNRGHNVIAHPCVCMCKRFWNDISNRYDDNFTPMEDLLLWTSAINRGYKFYICKEKLLYYRIHNNQVSNAN